MRWWLACVILTGLGSAGLAQEKSAAERGREHLQRHAFNPAFWSEKAYQQAWQRWGVKEKPGDYDRAFRERYGLHAAPYDNEGKPLGILPVQGLFGKGITQSCLMCHAGSLFGQTVVGLGNTALDNQTLTEDLFAADGLSLEAFFPFQLSHARGTIDPVSPVAFFMKFRDAELSLQKPIELGLPQASSSRPPAWWQMKKKRTRDWTGGIDARSDRVDMAFLLSPFNSAATIKKQEPIFADLREFVLSVEAPKYPFAVDAALAEQGRPVFKENCAKCHGSYGPGASYPSKIVPLKTIGTDPRLAESLTGPLLEHYNKSWLAQQSSPEGPPYQLVDTRGYQAPALDGVWATGPYFHNASVPTLHHVLNSQARPRYFTRSYRTDDADFDRAWVGWKFEELKGPADARLPAHERRRVYDTTRPGLSNSGHTFGDELSEGERRAVLEYLKTL
jgi:hypothetical protein